VRPDHLFLGTTATNAADKVRKGRQARCGPGTPERGEDRYNARLTEDDVRLIRSLHASSGITQAAIAKQFGVGNHVIYKVVHRLKWKHVI